MIVAVASRAHRAWQQAYRGANGDKPRLKSTNDVSWVERNGADQADIAALDYSHLPSDWQEENRLAATTTVDLILDAAHNHRRLDDEFIEHASKILHAKWLERNADWATDIQKRAYAELPEGEKEKDRLFVRAAIEVHGRYES